MPEWFRPWVLVEQEATNLWTYELAMVPGLLQTEAYARAMLSGDEALVAARLERQKLLTRTASAGAEHGHALDDSARCATPSATEVMREQIEHLAASASRERPVQIIPDGARTYHHLDGPFVIATLDGRDLVYIDSPVGGSS